MLQKLLGMGQQVVKRGTTSPANPTKELMEKMAQEGPEVIGKGTSRARTKADDILDATYEEITPTTGMDDMSLWNRLDKKKAAALLGLGGTGAYLMSGDDQVAPKTPQVLAPEPVKVEEAKKPEELKAEVKKTVKTEEPKIDGLDFDALAKKFDESMAGLPQDEALTDSALMGQAIGMENDNRFMNTLLRAGIQAGSAIAGGSANQIKADYSGVDALEKGISAPTSNMKTMMETESKTLARDKVKAELNDDVAMRNPDSEISKMVTGIAQKVGILKPGQVASAMDLKNAGVNLGTLLATIEAGNARRDAAALSRDLRADEKSSAREFKAEEEAKKREDKRKLVTEEIEARKRTIEDNIKRASDIIEKYGTVEATGPQAELLQGMLDEIAVDTAKLQDPDSVARPAEVELVRKSLVPEDTLGRMTMTNSTAKTILDQFKKRIQERAATGYKVRGIEQPAPRETGGDNNSGGMVKVMPPGGTKPKLIPADQVEAALAAGGKLVK
jgi:hypothetical protein